MSEIRSLVDFDKLTPDFAVTIFSNSTDLRSLILGKEKSDNETADAYLRAAGVKSSNLLENL